MNILIAAARPIGGVALLSELLADHSNQPTTEPQLPPKVIIGPSKKSISICVTTYKGQSFYTHACLEAIRTWKNDSHELLVACHDQTLLLEFYLRACKNDGLIDNLIFTPSGFGHIKGVNRCFQEATGQTFINIANDIQIGPMLIQDCADKLRDQQLGLIGWHWYNEGTFWNGNKITKYQLRDEKKPGLDQKDAGNIRAAPWFTGKVFSAIGEKWLCLCNTAFFAIRRELWNKLGGFSNIYKHYWADDFLNYAVLDQGLDVRNFDARFRHKDHFFETQYAHTDTQDRHRDDDRISLPSHLARLTEQLAGGLSQTEKQLLFQVARSLGHDLTVLHVGTWMGAGLALFMAGMKDKRTKFIGIDCFDMAGISAMSGQPPVKMEETISNLSPLIAPTHELTLFKRNTLDVTEFPKADVIFIDAGHTRLCVQHDIKLAKQAIRKGGMIIFHDYGQKTWPDVKLVIDGNFAKDKIRTFDTIAIVEV